MVKLTTRILNAALIALLLALLCGCGGISASHSISPASFFLPGMVNEDSGRQSGEELPEIREAAPHHSASDRAA